ncbi:MAG: ABC transporter permease [Desulfobulbus sp.]|jgi:ABC-type transport system involved in multi-copper enzyme maturation permease subunit|nr:MAG: ABC transporter permease [Desulfobulbus sp.]
MNALKTIWAIGLISFQEGLRRRIIYGVVLASLLFMSFAVLISGLFMRDIVKIMLDLSLSAVSVSGLLVPFIVGITLLSGDMEQRTIYTILAQPVSRAHYILGKYLGFAMLTSLIMGILTGATIVTVWGSSHLYAEHFFTSLSFSAIFLSSLMSLLAVLVLNSAMILWCCVTTSSFLATLLTLATYLIGQTVEDIIRFISLHIAGAEVSGLVQKTVQVALYLFPNLAAFDFKQQAAYGLPIPLHEVILLGIYGAAYITVMLLLAIVIFNKRDLA